jgi:hypothetical protein
LPAVRGLAAHYRDFNPGVFGQQKQKRCSDHAGASQNTTQICFHNSGPSSDYLVSKSGLLDFPFGFASVVIFIRVLYNQSAPQKLYMRPIF